MADMIKPLPMLTEQYRVCPVRFGPDPKNPDDVTPEHGITFLHQEQLPQPFETLDTALEAAKAVINATGQEYVIMKVEQTFVAASFLFELVNPAMLMGTKQ